MSRSLNVALNWLQSYAVLNIFKTKPSTYTLFKLGNICNNDVNNSVYTKVLFESRVWGEPCSSCKRTLGSIVC
jgi:hypothetical protein